MWMCLEEGEEVVGGRREVFWAVVGVGLCDRRKGWRWMAGEEMMSFSFSVCCLLYWKDGTGWSVWVLSFGGGKRTDSLEDARLPSTQVPTKAGASLVIPDKSCDWRTR